MVKLPVWITLEDILEEIVGEIHDEYDENEEDFVHKISDKEYLVEGSVNLDDFNDRLELNLESEEYVPSGGFIIEHLEPASGTWRFCHNIRWYSTGCRISG